MCIPFSRHDPYLQELYRLYRAGIHFAMGNTHSGTHRLSFSDSDDTAVFFAVTMLQMPLQWSGDNLHIFIRVGLEPFSRSDFIAIQYAEDIGVGAVRIEVSVETEGMVAIQPVIPGVSSCIYFMYYFLYNFPPF